MPKQMQRSILPQGEQTPELNRGMEDADCDSFSYLWQNTWEKQLTEDRFILARTFKGLSP
jgi:hypothetical protein